LACAAVALPLTAQEAYFQEEKANPWIPAWELTAQAEREDAPPGGHDFDRSDLRLRLRWTFDLTSGFELKAGTVSYLGSDGNAKNLFRQDNQPSNGSRLDLAELRFSHVGESAGLELQGGLVDNPMLVSESLWDPELRIIGGSGRAFFRTESVVEELGLRGAAGEVRLLNGGRVRVRAGQAVARFVFGAFTATAHGGIWDLQPRQEDAPLFLRQNGGAGINPDGSYYGDYGTYGNAGGYADAHYRYTVYGAQVDWDGAVPVAVSAQRQRRQQDGDIGQDFQVWVGSPTRRWWPQAGFIHQILDTDGALGSINGDRWWYHSDAAGDRYVLALNLPQRWRVSVEYMDQTRGGGLYDYRRTDLILKKRF
ncbi:MAG TPA: hypothetical protein VL181_08875, partial [Holophagaceae bacterium]|nr:hypothetical protein [Holophagaceae bacterium]